jgi:hypothetical protein
MSLIVSVVSDVDRSEKMLSEAMRFLDNLSDAAERKQFYALRDAFRCARLELTHYNLISEDNPND